MMRLVPNWRSAWKWWSQWCNSAGIAAAATWGLIPADMRSAVPSWVLAAGAGALFVLGFIARMVDQNKPAQGSENVDASE